MKKSNLSFNIYVFFVHSTDESSRHCVVRMVSDIPKGTPISALIRPPRPDGLPDSSLESPPEATAEDMERIREIARCVLRALAWLNHHSMNHRDLQVSFVSNSPLNPFTDTRKSNSPYSYVNLACLQS